MGRALKMITASAASASLVASTTAVAAAAPAPAPAPQAAPANTAQPQQPNSWMMLAALSSGAPRETVRNDPAIAAAVAAGGAQGAAAPTAYGVGHRFVTGEVVPFLLWFGLIVVALSIAGSSGSNAGNGTPNSPT